MFQMEWIIALVIALISSSAVFGGIVVLKKIASSSSGDKEVELTDRIESLNDRIAEILEQSKDLFSKKQVDKITGQIKEISSNLESQKNTLKQVEQRLDVAQKTIEEKEQYHQSLKASKAEDEEKLTDLLARYEDIAAESISLEQQLAASLKNLDLMLSELDLSQDQKAVIQELQEALTAGGSQLRELYVEYEGVKGRIDTLNAQLEDLETEYTRLVEQQLGEGYA